ncbi:hypothetical protein Ddye_013921 [Dipteronia dyeriana]|uniref:Uncharacterized protein n=1 Tax=Dipteronia dyeriana TaxID=168575 RepID=A0AAD9X772_9ROSI|nr:hypothetical protein Ddye_013921 [Dipteronia dyeriana]
MMVTTTTKTTDDGDKNRGEDLAKKREYPGKLVIFDKKNISRCRAGAHSETSEDTDEVCKLVIPGVFQESGMVGSRQQIGECTIPMFIGMEEFFWGVRTLMA